MPYVQIVPFGAGTMEYVFITELLFHFRECVPMDEKEFLKWHPWDMTFVCGKCAFTDGQYDFAAAMRRYVNISMQS